MKTNLHIYYFKLYGNLKSQNNYIYTIYFIYYKISVSQAIKVKLVTEFKNELMLFLFHLLHHYSIND